MKLIVTLHLAIILLSQKLHEVSSFLCPSRSTFSVVSTHWSDTTELYGKRKLSFAEKKRMRNQKQKRTVSYPKGQDDGVRPDSWTDTKTEVKEDEKENAEKMANEIHEKASSMVQAQKKSVEMLTFIRETVEDTSTIPYEKIKAALEKPPYYYVHDSFFQGSDSTEEKAQGLIQDLKLEAESLYKENRLSLTEVGSGEFGSPLTGGENYQFSPRCVEYVVSMTKHLPALLGGSIDDSNDDDNEEKLGGLDDSASMGSIVYFDRASKQASFSFLSDEEKEKEKNRAFDFVNGKDIKDIRKVTALYFMTDPKWSSDEFDNLGGGITIRNKESGEDVFVAPKRDRLLFMRSDLTLHSRNIWNGSEEEGLGNGAYLMTHFIQKRRAI